MGSHRGSVLGPVLFSISINNLDNKVMTLLIKFTSTLDDRIKILNYLGTYY